jgi:hypothetical protein
MSLISKYVNEFVEQSPSLEVIVAQLMTKFLELYRTRMFITFSQEPAIDPYPEEAESSPHLSILFLADSS